ncbi:MAG TPA: hypothetical protein DCE42_25980 [Myxococcales bacterium]|nr:hypothetical protein [Deltaproteobacteria bacterium]MBU54526.1 hypothetical protein [Deltaproteobacteria bacterium]HAA58240.1 hypothetical protein [Myxococcales bacterium]
MPRPIRFFVLFVCLFVITSAVSCSPALDCGVCPLNTTCTPVTGNNGTRNFICLRNSSGSEVGGVCFGNNRNCLSGNCYAPDGNQNLSYCTIRCKIDADCNAGYTCKAEAGGDICVRGAQTSTSKGCECGKEGASCNKNGHSDCATKEGYFCLSTGAQDANARCTKQCDPNDTDSCASGLICTATPFGQYLCIQSPYPKSGLGGNCSKGGKAQCEDDQYCYTRWPNDTQAFCTKYCNPYQEGDCPKDYSCESPREQDPYLCVPKGTGKVGDDCSARDVLDCETSICAQLDPRNREERPICTQSCSPTTENCPAGFRCRLYGHLYRYLCAKSGDGGIGTICNKNGDADCKSKMCIQPDSNSINKICTEPCDGTQPCPDGYTCDLSKKVCLPATGKKKIGDPCTGPQECVFGTCVTDSSGKQFCTQQCTKDEQCPGGYQCRNLEFTQLYCLPEQKGDKEVGEACPNGPGDCKTNKCISDFIKNRTFCTQSCNDQIPCQAPYVCTKISDTESYCTPKDYEAP